MTDGTAKNINLLGIRARAYHARGRIHTLTSKHPSNCWTQRTSHRNHLISASTHCISIDFSKKSAVSCPFLPLWGNIPLYTSRGCATKANIDRALVYTPYSLHAWHFMPLRETQRRCRKTSFATPPHQFHFHGESLFHIPTAGLHWHHTNQFLALAATFMQQSGQVRIAVHSLKLCTHLQV